MARIPAPYRLVERSLWVSDRPARGVPSRIAIVVDRPTRGGVGRLEQRGPGDPITGAPWVTAAGRERLRDRFADAYALLFDLACDLGPLVEPYGWSAGALVLGTGARLALHDAEGSYQGVRWHPGAGFSPFYDEPLLPAGPLADELEALLGARLALLDRILPLGGEL